MDYQDHASGTRTVFGYDGRGLIGSVWHKNNGSGQTLSYRDYWRDDRDRITAWRKSLDGSVNPMENGRGDRYGYDEAGQLTLASYQTSNPNGNAPDPERVDVFNYDALGNRMQDNHVASHGWMNFKRDDNGLNQYTDWMPYNFIKYDDDIGNGWGAPQAANGVLLQDGWITAGFNALNQPKMIASQSYNGTGNWMWFGFDPLGRCVKRWIGPPGAQNTATTSFYYYDGWNLLQEEAGGANAQRLYIHGARVDEWSPLGRDDTDGRPEGRVSGRRASQIVKSFNYTTGQSAYHHYDARGHCTMLTDSHGDILEQYDYDAFGFPRFYDATGSSLTFHDGPSNTERGISPYGNRFLFTGREWLTDLKLYDYRNRVYQPELGRFLQPDPKGFSAGDYNLYRYCRNDPVNHADPTGLITIIIPGLGPQRDRGGNWSNEVFIRRALERFKDGRVFSRNELNAARKAIDFARSHGDKTLNIVGYSLGGAAGVKLAGDLGRSGISVDRLVTVDIVRAPGFDSALLPNPVPIPSNVKEAYNYYQQSGGFHPTNFKGTPVTGDNVLVNREITAADIGGPVHHAWMPGFVFPER